MTAHSDKTKIPDSPGPKYPNTDTPRPLFLSMSTLGHRWSVKSTLPVCRWYFTGPSRALKSTYYSSKDTEKKPIKLMIPWNLVQTNFLLQNQDLSNVPEWIHSEICLRQFFSWSDAEAFFISATLVVSTVKRGLLPKYPRGKKTMEKFSCIDPQVHRSLCWLLQIS